MDGLCKPKELCLFLSIADPIAKANRCSLLRIKAYQTLGRNKDLGSVAFGSFGHL
jgi:hypothetical protein